MSWVLFMDESGHDHGALPYEVRGGIALHTSKIWPFTQQWQRLEVSCYGAELSQFRTEVKGQKLLDKDRFRWASQSGLMDDEERRRYCRRFLTRGIQGESPTRPEFTAYGQASLEMARGIFELLEQCGARLFACAVPKGLHVPKDSPFEDFLRRDHVFLFERYYYLLEAKQEHGLIAMDEAEDRQDKRFARRLQRYFEKTHSGRFRASLIVPTPFFVASHMTEPVQAADLCLYTINWSFRLPRRGMDAGVREDIAAEFGPWLTRLQYHGQGYRDGEAFETYGIVFVRDPFLDRKTT